MKTYCMKGRKDTENIDPKMVRTKNNRLVMQSKCSVCGIKKSRFKDKAFKIASDPKYDGYQRGLGSMVYKFFDKKSKGSGIVASLANKSANEPNYQLANELHKPIIIKF